MVIMYCFYSSVAEEDFDSYLRNTKFQYEAFRSSSKSLVAFFGIVVNCLLNILREQTE